MDSIPKPTNSVRLSQFARSFLFLFATSSVAAFCLYFGIIFFEGNDPYFAPVLVFDGYHGGSLLAISEHPFPFLLSMSFMLSLLAAVWIAFIAPQARRFQSLQALLVPWLAMILASPIWGVIWSVYRWPPGSFSDPAVMMLFYRHDALFGLNSGWVSALLSFPINILSFALSYGLILLSKKVFMPANKKP